ncbi:DUF4383 domain-containing protein [Prauserella muralis]|uniref:DUF4383 domain-containing protein n=1 Tax=Prauserella muralis TaxID=588067 RepID=A0A2V4BFJ1_9PSEU|nr:DUF4383 domain-containing protein [Prauserella muralis]PXY28359.1 hypothetical protein BAY60_12850 [Prauserella muralis]
MRRPVSPDETETRRTPWLRLAALFFGVVYLALGIAGFVLHGGGDLGPDADRTVWVFGVSALFNIVHTGVGLLGLLCSHRTVTARIYGWLLFFGFAGLTAYSVAGTVLGGSGDIANATAANTVLYACTAAIGLVVSLLPGSGRTPAGDRP